MSSLVPKLKIFLFFILDFTGLSNKIIRISFLLIAAHCLLFTVSARQKVAIITPEKNKQTEVMAERLENFLSEEHKIIDRDLSETAFRSFNYENPFNLTVKEAKNIGTAIGCDYFLLIKSDTQRRASFEQDSLYESFAVIYTVSSRTGNLIFWKIQSLKASEKVKAEKSLFNSIKDLSAEISKEIISIQKNELTKKESPDFEEIPETDAPEAVGFRPPLPYKRIRPKYTDAARLYGIEATVDIEIDVSGEGEILRAEIVRWAGFGLDESVKETVLKMNWRPASRNEKPIPTRALLRYNFKNIEND